MPSRSSPMTPNNGPQSVSISPMPSLFEYPNLSSGSAAWMVVIMSVSASRSAGGHVKPCFSTRSMRTIQACPWKATSEKAGMPYRSPFTSRTLSTSPPKPNLSTNAVKLESLSSCSVRLSSTPPWPYRQESGARTVGRRSGRSPEFNSTCTFSCHSDCGTMCGTMITFARVVISSHIGHSVLMGSFGHSCSSMVISTGPSAMAASDCGLPNSPAATNRNASDATSPLRSADIRFPPWT